MADITLTIDGKQAKGARGDMILDVCRKNGIDVPTLCHFPGLPNAGSCRMCIVEIQGTRGFNTACTTPAADGMVVRTDTEELNRLREDTLQLLFSERNHFCMFCESSGDCELQAMAYRFKMDHFTYPFMYPKLPVDASPRHFALDHNRCILCTRCVRVCGSLAAIDTLGVRQRSASSMICADLDVPIGESTCTSCGACVQVCPTGALFEKNIAYRRRRSECTVAKSVCPSCSVGCGVDIVSRTKMVLAVEGDFESEVNKGLLCVKGRFLSVGNPAEWFDKPLLRREGVLVEVSWDEALAQVSQELRKIKDASGAEALAGVASSRASSEDLFVFGRLVREVLGSEHLFGVDCRVAAAQDEVEMSLLGEKVNIEARLDDVAQADCLMVVGVDLEQGYPVLDSLIRRAVKEQGAKLIVLDTEHNSLAARSDVSLRPKPGTLGQVVNGLLTIAVKAGKADLAGAERFVADVGRYDAASVAAAAYIGPASLQRAAAALVAAKRPLIVYGEHAALPSEGRVSIALAQLALVLGTASAGWLGLLAVREKANSRGARALGYVAGSGHGSIQGVLFMASDDPEAVFPEWARNAKYQVVQTAHRSVATDRADVVLPAPRWTASEGSYVSTEGRVRRFGPGVESETGTWPGWRAWSELSRLMGGETSYSSVQAVAADLARSVPQMAGDWLRSDSRAAFSVPALACVDFASLVKK